MSIQDVIQNGGIPPIYITLSQLWWGGFIEGEKSPIGGTSLDPPTFPRLTRFYMIWLNIITHLMIYIYYEGIPTQGYAISFPRSYQGHLDTPCKTMSISHHKFSISLLSIPPLVSNKVHEVEVPTS